MTETREARRARLLRERQDRYDCRMAKAREIVPHGLYCYSRVDDPEWDARRAASGQPFVPGRYVPCPYYKVRRDKPEQMRGYCRLLKNGDWESPEKGGTMLLWDGCKECDVNIPTDAEMQAQQADPTPLEQLV